MKLKSILLTAVALLSFNTSKSQSWYQRASLPAAGRYASPSFSIGSVGFIVGGESASGILSDFWSYNSITDSWNALQPFPGAARVKPVGFQVNGFGFYGLGTDSTFFKYDPQLNQWSQISSPNFGVSYWSAMYFTEGADAYFLFSSSNVFAKYNTTTDTWIQLANFPGPARFTGSGFSANGKGYITCGVTSFGIPYLNDLWEYNISSNVWQQKSSLPATGRYATMAFSLNDNGYLLGGERFSPNITLNEFWQYNPTTDNWTQLQDFPSGGRNYLSGFIVNNNIYAGFGGFGYNNDLFLYGNLCSNTTSIGPSILPSTISSNVSFTSTSSVTGSSYQWQTNPANIGWLNIIENSTYSGSNASNLDINDLQISNHNQPFRLITTSGNCIDTSNVATINILDTCITNLTVNDTITTQIFDTTFVNQTVYDTTFVNQTIHDTTYVYQTIYDTTYVNQTIYDTIYVNETIYDSLYVTVYDTAYISVTDTLIINATITGINPPNNLNTLKVYPNPASTHITIDYGNFNAMSGYTLTIVNSIGQTVFTTPINQQTSYIDLSTWTGTGIYFVHLIDPQNNTIENRKIVIQ
jgi:N-acetylneuraminic acid mutarotase